MDIVLSPLTLRFSNDVLEREYVFYRSSGTFMTTDWRFSVLNLAMYTSVMAFDVFVRTGVSIKSFGFRALGLVTVLVQRTLMVHLPKEYWIQYRNYFIALFRTLRLFVFLHGVLWRMEDPSIDAFLLFKPMVLQSGVLINVWYCLGMPLLFLQHLVLHTLHLGLTLWMNSGQICVKILETKKSSQIFTQFAELVDGVLSGFVAVHKVVDGGDERLVKLCPKMLILCHFFIGLLVPTLILWRMEIVSRQSFFEEVICHGEWSWLHLDSSWIPNTSSIVVLALVSASTCWSVFADF